MHPHPQSHFPKADRILAIGDVHGNYQGLLTILQSLDLLDENLHWCGGETHLIQMGDILGRGGEPGQIYSLMHRLEKEATMAGGAVHLLLGNHEVMALRGSLVYNTVAEFTDISLYAPSTFGRLTSTSDWTAVDARKAKYERRLEILGGDTFQRYLQPEGPIGEWLLAHPSAMVIGDTLFVHGGLNRIHGLIPLDDLNQNIRHEIDLAARGEAKPKHLVKDGPQWNRGYTLAPSDARREELQAVLHYHHCARMVVGHTPTGYIQPLHVGEVVSLYEKQLWCIDTGIGQAYGGHLSALCIENGTPRALYPG